MSALILAIVAAGSFAIVFVGYLGLVGKLPRNPFAGIRIPYTMRSDENWYNTHRGAAPAMIFGGVLVLSIALAFLPFAIAGRIGDGLTFGVTIVCAVIILCTVVIGTMSGLRYAKARAAQVLSEQ